MLPKSFRFSPILSLIAVALAGTMLWASSWQWQRYQWKSDLVATYESHAEVEAIEFPLESDSFEAYFHKKVRLSGVYDLSRQIIVLNRQHQTGPGYWLLAPFKIDGSDKHVIVSRGFIPFADREKESWGKYDVLDRITIDAVLQKSVKHKTFLSPKSTGAETPNTFIEKWRYPDVAKIAKQLPYPVIPEVFLQKLGGPTEGTFPAEAITIRVPPSTHFGYMIEWALMAVATLGIAFFIQAFPRQSRRTKPVHGKAASLVLLSVFIYSEPGYCAEDAEEVVQDVQIIEHLGQTIDMSLEFVGQDGVSRPLSEYVVDGKPIFLTPVYYRCPSLCSGILTAVSSLLNSIELELGTDFSAVAASFNYRESADIASAKALNYYETLDAPEQGPKGWPFLVGSKENVAKLLDQLGLVFPEDAEDFLHSPILIVLSPDGLISRYIYGLDYDQRDVRLALIDASKGKIGNTLDRVLLYCFRFDQNRGKYTLAIWNITRIISLGGFFLLISVLLGLRIREIKQPRIPKS